MALVPNLDIELPGKQKITTSILICSHPPLFSLLSP